MKGVHCLSSLFIAFFCLVWSTTIIAVWAGLELRMLGRAIENLLAARKEEGVPLPGAGCDRRSIDPAGVASRLDNIEKRLEQVEKPAEGLGIGT